MYVNDGTYIVQLSAIYTMIKLRLDLEKVKELASEAKNLAHIDNLLLPFFKITDRTILRCLYFQIKIVHRSNHEP